jgi:hypothetical protein
MATCAGPRAAGRRARVLWAAGRRVRVQGRQGDVCGSLKVYTYRVNLSGPHKTLLWIQRASMLNRTPFSFSATQLHRLHSPRKKSHHGRGLSASMHGRLPSLHKYTDYTAPKKVIMGGTSLPLCMDAPPPIRRSFFPGRVTCVVCVAAAHPLSSSTTRLHRLHRLHSPLKNHPGPLPPPCMHAPPSAEVFLPGRVICVAV